MKSWSKDIGALVKKGDELAEIDTPELDERVAQAQQELGRAQASLSMAKVTAERWAALRNSSAVSKQSADEKSSDEKVKQADVGAASANLDRLKAQKIFARIVAPFDGVVTARNIDIGSYVAPDRSSEVLFKVADIHAVRLYVHVPQIYSSRLKSGMKASFTTPQRPEQSFSATVSTTSNAIGVLTGSLLVELDTPNPDGALFPGSYADVHFELPVDPNSITHRLQRFVDRRTRHARGHGRRRESRAVQDGGHRPRSGRGSRPRLWAFRAGSDHQQSGRNLERRRRRADWRRDGGRSSPGKSVGRHGMRRLSLLRMSLCAALAGLAGCDLTPNYAPPAIAVPEHYKTAPPAGPIGEPQKPGGAPFAALNSTGWRRGSKRIIRITRRRWRVTSAPGRCLISPNPPFTLRSWARRRSATISSRKTGRCAPLNQPTYYGANQLVGSFSWELDVWGRINDLVAAAKAGAQSNDDLLAAVQLSLHAGLARTYIALRGADAQAALLARTIGVYQSALKLTQERLKQNIAPPIDVERAKVQLASAQAAAADIAQGRAVLENALAVLSGQTASFFRIAAEAKQPATPRPPHAAPAVLLLRRPDVAANERLLFASNERIGAAKADFLPRFTSSCREEPSPPIWIY